MIEFLMNIISGSGIRYNFVCHGNSLTVGEVGNNGKSYPTLLSEKDEAIRSNWVVNNMGINGESGQRLITFYDRDVTPLYNENLSNIYIIWEVTNDLYFSRTVRQAVDNIWSLVALARNIGFDKIIVINTLPRNQQKQDGTSIEIYNQDLDAANVLLADEYQSNNVDILIDVRSHPELTDATNNTYFGDGIHLREAGYQVLVDDLYPKILAL